MRGDDSLETKIRHDEEYCEPYGGCILFALMFIIMACCKDDTWRMVTFFGFMALIVMTNKAMYAQHDRVAKLKKANRLMREEAKRKNTSLRSRTVYKI